MQRMYNGYGGAAGAYRLPVSPGGGGRGQGTPYLRPAPVPSSRTMKPVPPAANHQRWGRPWLVPPVVPGWKLHDPLEYPAGGYAIIKPGSALGAGWTRVDCGIGLYPVCTYTGATTALCGGAAVFCSSVPQGSMSGNVNGEIQEWGEAGPGFFQTVMQAVWTRNPGTVGDFPLTSGSPAVWPVPAPLTWPLPWSLPGGAVEIAPASNPKPLTAPNPLREPNPARDPDGRPRARPYERPAWEYQFPAPRPGGRTVPRPRARPVRHRDVPDKAKKVRNVPAAMVAAIKLFHAATEVEDFVDVLYEALPNFRKKGEKGLVDRLAAVAANWDSVFVDAGTFDRMAEGLILNSFEDRVLGALFGANWRAGVPMRGDNYSGSVYVDAAMQPM